MMEQMDELEEKLIKELERRDGSGEDMDHGEAG
jgi:hypothetical protein